MENLPYYFVPLILILLLTFELQIKSHYIMYYKEKTQNKASASYYTIYTQIQSNHKPKSVSYPHLISIIASILWYRLFYPIPSGWRRKYVSDAFLIRPSCELLRINRHIIAIVNYSCTHWRLLISCNCASHLIS